MEVVRTRVLSDRQASVTFEPIFLEKRDNAYKTVGKRRLHPHLMHLQNHWSIGVGAEKTTNISIYYHKHAYCHKFFIPGQC